MTNRFKWNTSGKAPNENIIIKENVRFTVLTDRLIRIEYDTMGNFVDEASQTVFYRDFEKPVYTVSEEDGILNIETDYLKLNYYISKPFGKDSLSIQLKQYPATCWQFGEKVSQLKGTACTLDNANGEIELEDGVCSRKGYTVIDDSESLLLTDEGWFKVRETEEIDMYFFGYGHDYRGCIADFYRLTGAPPLLPDYALGNWWSRYYRYTQQEYCDLMERFEKEDVPFSVSVVDMDWHTTEIPKESYIDHPHFRPGWTGYSWNKELFPDYKDFLKFLKKHNLKTALNLHPSNGVGCHEDMYDEMAKACGIDPETKKLVKFDLLNPDFMEKYFDILHHPYEADGVDFWWMDWQQGDDYWWVRDEEHPAHKLEKMSPLWLLNHLHILDIMRNGKRPMFFSRYCGLGAHRYPVGFSGDTIVTWESLDFQPYFTANASNAGYCWWSHDIGGHMQGYRNDELQIRWLQLGVLSPINRLHSSNNPFTGKEPWNLNEAAKPIAIDWLQKRHELFPYIYTMNYRTHKDLQPLIQPMYYSHPECDEAYSFRNQYWFGSELIVAPITTESDKHSMLGEVKVWLPEGEWTDFFTGLVYKGNRTLKIHRNLKQFPVFAKAGAIVPMEDYAHNNTLGSKENMWVYVFPGADNTFRLYEDSGDGSEYIYGGFATTQFDFKWGKKATFTIRGSVGDTTLIPDNRNWNICFSGFTKDIVAQVTVAGKKVSADCSYDESTNTTVLKLENVSTLDEVVITLSADNLMTDNSSAKAKIHDILLHAQMSYEIKTALWDAVCNGKGSLFNYCTEEGYSSILSAVEELYSLL